VANLTLEDVPVSVLEDYVAARARRRRMRETGAEFERFPAALPRMSDSTEPIREDRGGLSR
jgi:hypothetical protein